MAAEIDYIQVTSTNPTIPDPNYLTNEIIWLAEVATTNCHSWQQVYTEYKTTQTEGDNITFEHYLQLYNYLD